MLEFKHVTKKQGAFELSNINFSLEEGYLLGIVGKNGSGKTTLMKCMLEESSTYTGTIMYQGEDIRRQRRKFMEQTAYIGDDNVFLNRKAAIENVDILGGFYPEMNREKFKTCMKAMQLSYAKTVGDMSRGEFIRFQIAFARARNARLYLLDEATAGMDPVFRKEFYDILREILVTKATILMTTHVQADINKNMDYVCCLQAGRMLYFQENPGDV